MKMGLSIGRLSDEKLRDEPWHLAVFDSHGRVVQIELSDERMMALLGSILRVVVKNEDDVAILWDRPS